MHSLSDACLFLKHGVLYYIHGQKDTMVTINGSREYIAEIEKLGIKNQLAEIPYCNHGTSTKVNYDITMNFLKDIPDMMIELQGD